MSLAEHLVELRKRLLLAGAGILACMIPAWLAYDAFSAWLYAPIMQTPTTSSLPPLLPEVDVALRGGVNFRSVTAPFSTQLRFAAWAGLIMAAPWWLAQLWLFFVPALTKREKRALVWASLPSAVLFLCGAGVALAFLPKAVEILLSLAPKGSATFIDADAYLSFAMLLVVAISLSFVTPVAIVSAHALGLFSVRFLVTHWRWFTLAACTFAAVVNPLPDAWSMLLQAAVLLLLHWVAVGVCALRERRQRARTHNASRA